MANAEDAARARRGKAERRAAMLTKAANARAAYTIKARHGERCTICMTNVSHITRTTLGCSHPFHRRCLKRLLRFTLSCPVCRRPFNPPYLPDQYERIGTRMQARNQAAADYNID